MISNSWKPGIAAISTASELVTTEENMLQILLLALLTLLGT